VMDNLGKVTASEMFDLLEVSSFVNKDTFYHLAEGVAGFRMEYSVPVEKVELVFESDFQKELILKKIPMWQEKYDELGVLPLEFLKELPALIELGKEVDSVKKSPNS